MSNQDELKAIFIEESKDCLNHLLDSMSMWSEELDNHEPIRDILAQLHTIKGAANLVDEKILADLIHRLEVVFQNIQNKNISISQDLHGKLLFAIDYILSLIEAIEQNSTISNDHSIIKNIERDVQNILDATQTTEATEVEPDLLHIFIEEASEILETLKEEMAAWQVNAADEEYFHSAHRQLHTLKGAARLSGFEELGEYAHKLESVISALLDAKQAAPNDFFDFFLNALDQIEKSILEIKNSGKTGFLNFSAIADYQSHWTINSSSPVERVANEKQNKPLEQKQRKGFPNTIKLETKKLEDLSNLAISANISSGHLRQQLSELRMTFLDSGNVIQTFQEQLKHIEAEKNKEIFIEQEREYQEFDTVEFDQYTSVEKIIHHLMISISELLSYQDIILKRINTCEGLASEQKKSTRSIEEQLIHARLVSFESLRHRFERITRQVSHELKKDVKLSYRRIEGEMDRNVLEKILSPIEHLIRNAVDHGIESPEERQSLGKNETGTIELSLVRKGADVIIEMFDDGRGLDPEKIYKAALKKGLISADEKLTEKEIINLVMIAGFSTRDDVTQISGRGIGMDVVNSEIKKLGGSLMISSEPNKGAKFTLRLPFTLSLNKVLIFEFDKGTYALPVSALNGVIRLKQSELINKMESDDSSIEYMGERYQLVKLEKIFGKPCKDAMVDVQLPIILLGQQGGIALPVDYVIATKEIVIKSAGPQLKFMQMISGATLLEDGTIALVLDPLILMHFANEKRPLKISLPEKPNELPLIMVVDDSITVRKVTEGLLARHYYNVISAADGLEALEKIRISKPNVMLLDIEMPNMDGYALLKLIRSEAEFKDIPVIMITSRAAQKHSQKAFELGANLYLSKPFKEKELVDAITQLIGVHNGYSSQ